jgi:hypothetical protein
MEGTACQPSATNSVTGEGIIPPVLSTSTAHFFSFTSRFWGALLATFPEVPP